MDREMKTTILEVMGISLVYNIVLWGISLLIYPHSSVLLGLALGMFLTDGMLLWIAAQLKQILGKEDKGSAGKKILISSFIRKFIFAAAFLSALFLFPQSVNPIALVAGSLGMKAGIYGHEIIKGKHSKKEESQYGGT